MGYGVLGGAVHLSVGSTMTFIWLKDRIPTKVLRASRRNDDTLGPSFKEHWIMTGARGVCKCAQSRGSFGGEAGKEGVEAIVA